MLGRDDIVAALVAQLPERRFITITGPGGIGKTTVALAAAQELAALYPHGAAFADLARISDPLLVPSVIASSLGLAIDSEDPVVGLIAFLRERRVLIVLDNCEHVVDAAARLAEAIVESAPDVGILATSREPTGARGELIQRLAPLSSPPRGISLTAASALSFPSVQLFVERVAANVDGFGITDSDARVVADICLRLDGLPLAIELAASRVDAFGVGGLAVLLNDRFELLMRSRRASLPRHRTLGATFDWSYGALTGPERVVLRRLAVFASSFTLESASNVSSGSDVAAAEVIEHLADLVAKSLVVADIGHANPRYRLLNTTRAYALQKLTEAEEAGHFFRRHAMYHRDLLEHAVADRERRSAHEWLAAYGDLIDDVRSALDWSFSPSGDKLLGVALTLASVPLWTQLSLNEECRVRVEAALTSLDPDDSREPFAKLRLFVALGGATKYAGSHAPDKTGPWTSALEIAQRTGNTDYELRALWGLWAEKVCRGENRAALAFAERFAVVAATSADGADPLVSDRMLGHSRYILGEQTAARFHTERMLHLYTAPADRRHIVRFQFDQRVMARITLANILWVQGLPDQAMRVVEENIEEAREIDHEISLSYALAQSACPIALYCGDFAAAERFLKLLERPTQHASEPWNRWSRCYRGVLLKKQGKMKDGIRVLATALAEYPENSFHMRYIAFLGELAEGFAHTGDIGAGLATIDRALDASRRCEENWCVAELLRIKGEIIATQAGRNVAASSEACLREAHDCARQQKALSWELRAATSLARLLRNQGRPGDARNELALAYAQFVEGLATSDLTFAKSLLDELS
jgi:predicted ATPase